MTMIKLGLLDHKLEALIGASPATTAPSWTFTRLTSLNAAIWSAAAPDIVLRHCLFATETSAAEVRSGFRSINTRALYLFGLLLTRQKCLLSSPRSLRYCSPRTLLLAFLRLL